LKIRELFDLAREDCRFGDVLDTFAGGAVGVAEEATAFGGGAAEDQGVAAVLNDGLGFGVAVGAGDLGDRLEA